MTIEVGLVIAGLSLAFGIYTGVSTQKRAEKNETKSDATQLTTVIVKLENIGALITKIDSDMSNMKKDNQGNKEQYIKLETIVAQHTKKLEICDMYCRRLGDVGEQTQ